MEEKQDGVISVVAADKDPLLSAPELQHFE
jgi:hypothetical protein